MTKSKATRTVAVCGSLKRARAMVEENEGGIYKCSYRLAVIEAVAQDWIYPNLVPAEQYWYRWEGDPRNGRYRPVRTPPGYESQFGFGIG
jgi:hypothetical protein